MEVKQLSAGIFVIEGFWTEQECRHFIELSENEGYNGATVETEKGARKLENVRNNKRVLYNSAELANQVWQKVQQYAPPKIGNSHAIGLNEMFRFYRYTPGQKFKNHSDQSFIRNELEASYYTLMIYLNDDCTGGGTIFKNLTVTPKTGSALIFLHSLPHEGAEVTQGVKYVLRTDIMYRLDEHEST